MASLHDVSRGKLTREGRVRLAGGRLPEGGAGALAELLLTGAPSPLVELSAHRPAVSLSPPPPDAALAGGPRDGGPPRRARTLGWITAGTGIATVGLGVVGVLQTRSASESYERARRLRDVGALTTNTAILEYNGHVADGDAAKRASTLSWTGAAAAAVATGVLGYLNYRRTGEVGPFRF